MVRIHTIYQFIEDEDICASLQVATLIVNRNKHSNYDDFYERLDETRLNLFLLLEQLRILNKKDLKKDPELL
jgi:hypothetical protein